MISPYRSMKLLLLFDLPTIESYEKKEYLLFKKCLIRNGYYMIQYSVYIKNINTQIRIEQEVNKLKKYVPTDGNIRLIQITDKQYQNMYMLIGKKNVNEIYNNSDRYIKI